MTFAKFDPGTKVCLFNTSIYINSDPHRSSPNLYKKKIIQTVTKLNLFSKNLIKLNFKTAHFHILNFELIFPSQTSTIKPRTPG